MNIKTIVFFSLLLATHCANAVKQRRLNLTEKLITAIKQGTVRTKPCIQEAIDYHEKTLHKRLPKQQ